MNRKMTLFAFAGCGGCLGAMGLLNRVTPSAATAWRDRNPSPPNSAVSATEANPPPASQSSSRRVRPQNGPRC